MSCSDEEWIKLKFNELGGMIGKLMKRVDTLEKTGDKFIREIKDVASNTERLREKLQNA